MDRGVKLAVGDVLVRFGRILRVCGIKTETIEMRPFFEIRSNNGLTYSIQHKNLDSTQIRKLVTKEKLKELFQSVLARESLPMEVNVVESRSGLNVTDLGDSLRLVKTLWQEKQNHAGFLPGGKLTLYQQALAQASDEIAAVKGIAPDDAKKLILASLKQ
jgi:RNA polymerase-interacting CarD/CdnL/TRCF family regulator